MPDAVTVRSEINKRISQAIESELDSRGLKKAALSGILSQTYPTVFRKLQGERYWSLSDVAKLASEWGVPLSALVPDEVREDGAA